VSQTFFWRNSEKVSNMSQSFQEFIEKVVQNYEPLNNKEAWYCKYYLIPPESEQTDPKKYADMLMEIRKDPKVTWEFKTFLLQLVSIVYNHYIKGEQHEQQSV